MLDKSARSGGALLFRLMRSLGAMENGEIRCCGVTTGQGIALLALKTPGQATMRQLAEALGVSAGTATRVVDNLVRDGLVERAANPSDRRNVCVRPTPRGEKKIEALDECYRRFWGGVFGAVPKGRLSEVLSSLRLLVDAAEKARAACCLPSRVKSAQTKEGVKT